MIINNNQLKLIDSEDGYDSSDEDIAYLEKGDQCKHKITNTVYKRCFGGLDHEESSLTRQRDDTHTTSNNTPFPIH